MYLSCLLQGEDGFIGNPGPNGEPGLPGSPGESQLLSDNCYCNPNPTGGGGGGANLTPWTFYAKIPQRVTILPHHVITFFFEVYHIL